MTLQVKQGSFALNNAVGNQAVSWAVGGNWPSTATPKLVRFMATGQTADGTVAHGIGMLGYAASATQQWVLSQASDDTVAAVNSGQSARTDACIVLLSNGTPTVQAVATCVSLDTNGFTINVTLAPGVTGIQIGFVAFGGADITTVAVGSSSIPTTTGAQAISPAGFSGITPDCLLTAVPYQPASPTESVHSHFGEGWATRLPATAQGVAWMMEVDGSLAIDTQRGFYTTCCVGGAEAAIAGHVRGSLQSWDIGGFTVNWLDAAAATGRIWFYVAVKGGGWQAFSDTEATTNTSKVTAVSGFGANTPKGLLLVGSNGTADTATPDTANGDCLIALGASDGATEYAIANIQVNGSATSANSLAKRRLAATRALALVKAPTTGGATVCGDADATFQAGQVTLTWTGTDGTARKLLGLAVGDNFPAPVGSQYVGGANGGATTTTTTTLAYNGATAGNTLILAVGVIFSGVGTIVTPTSTPSETWAPAGAEVVNANGDSARLFYARNIQGGNYTITFGGNSGVTSAAAVVVERSGLLSAADPLDQTASSTSADGTATSQSATTSALSEQPEIVVVGCFTDAGGPFTITPGSGYTLRNTHAGAGNRSSIGVEDKRVTATTAVVGNFSTSGASFLTAIVGTFKEPPAGGGTVFTISAAGALTSGGVLVRQDNKRLAGALPDAGTLARRADKPLAGALSSGGTPAQQAQKPLAGALTSAGNPSNVKVAVQTLAGLLAAAGALVRRPARGLGGSLGPSGALARQPAKATGGALTTAGALGRVKKAALALAGALGTAGALANLRTRVIGLNGALTAAGALTRRANKAQAGGLAPAGALARRVVRALAGALGPTGALANVYQAGAAAVALGRIFALGARQLTMLAAGRLTTLGAQPRALTTALRARATTLAARARQLLYGVRGP